MTDTLTSICEHTLYVPAVKRGGVVLDLGANRGLFSVEMARRFDCSCHAIEPSPRLFAALPKSERLTPYHYAVSSSVGTCEFSVSKEPECSSMLRVPEAALLDRVIVPTIDLDTFVSRHTVHSVDLLKVDIEGAEIDVLSTASAELLTSIPQITVEFHDFNGLVDASDVGKVWSRMTQLAFLPFRFSLRSHFDVLFLNRRLVPLSRSNRLQLRTSPYIARFMRLLSPKRALARSF